MAGSIERGAIGGRAPFGGAMETRILETIGDPASLRRLPTGDLGRIADDKIAGSRRLSLQEVDRRSLPVRLRDGVARLFLPYL